MRRCVVCGVLFVPELAGPNGYAVVGDMRLAFCADDLAVARADRDQRYAAADDFRREMEGI